MRIPSQMGCAVTIVRMQIMWLPWRICRPFLYIRLFCRTGVTEIVSCAVFGQSLLSLRGDKDCNKAIHLLFMATTWKLWKHRNAIIFKQASPKKGAICDIKVATSQWMKIRIGSRGLMCLTIFSLIPAKDVHVFMLIFFF